MDGLEAGGGDGFGEHVYPFGVEQGLVGGADGEGDVAVGGVGGPVAGEGEDGVDELVGDAGEEGALDGEDVCGRGHCGGEEERALIIASARDRHVQVCGDEACAQLDAPRPRQQPRAPAAAGPHHRREDGDSVVRDELCSCIVIHRTPASSASPPISQKPPRPSRPGASARATTSA